jgi:hypothetical protein
MADHGSDYHRGEMDIQEQSATFDLFMGMTKWGSLGIAALLTFITLLFCTEAGFLGSAAAAVVMIVLGVVLLREKPEAAH